MSPASFELHFTDQTQKWYRRSHRGMPTAEVCGTGFTMAVDIPDAKTMVID